MYLGLLCRWPDFWELLRSLSRGIGSRRERVHPDDLLGLEIDLPPIDVQRRVARRLGATADASSAIADLTRRAQELSDALSVSVSARPDLNERGRLRAGWQDLELNSVMVPAENKVKVEPDNAYPNLGILSYGRGVFEKPDIDGSRTSAAVLNQVRSGQFIYSRLFAFEGAYAYVPPEFDGRFVSNEFPTFDPNPDLLDARWLANFLRSPSRWAELRGSSKGLGVRRQRVPVEAILSYRIWLPPIETQKSMVAAIERIESIQAARVDVDRRTSALVPAELNRAFAEPR
jgi:type I restriction enzyme S subunit